MLEKFVANELDINKVQELTREQVRVESDPTTWVSSTRSENGITRVRIGEQLLPENIARQFRWGAETVEHQYVVKVAHEYAHVVQEMFDQHLLRWLDGADNVPEDAIPYVQLYAALANVGGLHGLSQMDVYHEQSRSTGNLNVSVYEDMAETIGSYLLSSEYFLYRIQNARGQITQEQAEELVDHVVAVVANWKKGQE
jgi:Zn-dependent M16 (insulinase) family peptidase